MTSSKTITPKFNWTNRKAKSNWSENVKKIGKRAEMPRMMTSKVHGQSTARWKNLIRHKMLRQITQSKKLPYRSTKPCAKRLLNKLINLKREIGKQKNLHLSHQLCSTPNYLQNLRKFHLSSKAPPSLRIICQRHGSIHIPASSLATPKEFKESASSLNMAICFYLHRMMELAKYGMCWPTKNACART